MSTRRVHRDLLRQACEESQLGCCQRLMRCARFSAARLFVPERVGEQLDCADDNAKHDAEDVITPWMVAAKGPRGIDYDRVLTKFKAQRVDDVLRQSLRTLVVRQRGSAEGSDHALHHFFTRDVVLCHRDLDRALQEVSAAPSSAYLYTGRGPSAGAMHIGHVIPFLLTKYLQDVLHLPLVIQITDDEKYLFRDVPFAGDAADKLVTDNIKDIIAFGFDPQRTFIFRNTLYMGHLYPTVLRLQRALTASTVKHTLGLQDSDNIGKLAFPATQAAPCFASAFASVLPITPTRASRATPPRCVIPCAIDQDPFFVLARGVASRLRQPPPALLLTRFLPALKGMTHKMSSSAAQNGVITLHDTDNQVRKKLRGAFSGGRGTLESMRNEGADLNVDVAYQLIRFFCPDDALYAEVTTRYAAGGMHSGEVKERAAEVIIRDVLQEWRKRRACVGDEDVRHFMSVRRLLPPHHATPNSALAPVG